MELRHLLKTNFDLFDFDYTVDDPQFKKEVEQAIIDTYFFHEINGTPDYFKHSFRTRFLSAISYYNKLYNTTLLEYDPLINYKMSEALEQLSNTTGEQTNTTNTDSTTNTTNTGNTTTEDSAEGTTESEQTRSNTSQGQTINDLKQQTNENRKGSNYPQQQITAGNYLSDETLLDSEVTNTGTVDTTASDSGTTNDSTTTNSTGTSTTTDSNTSNQVSDSVQTSNQDSTQNTNMSYEKTVEGLTGTSYQELITKERSNILRIVGMVVAEMKPCFILVYQ